MLNDVNTEINMKEKPSLAHQTWVYLVPLIIAFLFDQLTWQRQIGLQPMLLVFAFLLGLSLLTKLEKKQVPWQSLLLLAPIIFTALMTVFRLDGFTNFTNFLVILSGLATLLYTFLNGQWPLYRIREHLLGYLRLALSVISEPITQLFRTRQSATSAPGDKKAMRKKALPYLRGLAIALPILLLLAALLAAADQIFADQLSALTDWLRIENLGEFIFRLFYILIFAYGMCGLLIYALLHSQEKQAINEDTPYFKPFLGRVECLMVLGSVNLLFAAFLIVQFQYFFAGQANISIEGFTYAEYARRGFFELVAVALISLGLFYLMSMITRCETKREKLLFNGLGALLLLQVGVMLVSAFQRLSLYEAAYGFTQLRTVTHVFMIWLGVLLAVVLLMQLLNRLRHLALALFLVLLGFSLTLNLLHVDAFIAKRNLEHAAAGNKLDAYYLVWNLSSDGVPVLFEHFLSPETSPEMQKTLGAVLACRNAKSDLEEEAPFWASYHASRAKAERLFAENIQALNAYPLTEKDDATWIMIEDQEIYCGQDMSESLEATPTQAP